MREYSGALEYLFSLEKFGIVFGLENIRWLLGLVGDPQNAFKAVHVGGTNGKGSVATMLAAMLHKAGYGTGKYTSPHLLSFTERVTVNEVPMSEENLVDITATLREAVERADRDRFFTFFDFTTALAFEQFRRKKVEVAVAEVGLGGRLDSTNVLVPLVSIITNVAMDHMDYLGDTIGQIAVEKAGVIKEGVPAVTGAEGEALEIIRGSAAAKDSRLYVLGEDFSFRKTGDQMMSYEGVHHTMEGLYVNLKGDHQLANSAVALCALEILSGVGFNVTEKDIREALAEIDWPGRLEVVREHPIVLLDGAHNPHGCRSLARYLKERYPHTRKVLVFGVMKDKKFQEMMEILTPLMDKVILTTTTMDRAAQPEALTSLAPGALVRPDIKEALETAQALATEKDMIIVTGSLYILGEAKAYIDEIF
jgi:dihydrofolate synthase / folylpolyglutamate synthase